ncbi:winged helix-turn-helix transcriptional regulator [Pseudonocardia sp. T1-2H]|uniref:winged helix-turn-helix transcriptional regulator n=1 Tax=Pseudonocardia sp. T1-2H TaxID=3128899 RepID=UPI003101888A
MTIAGDDVRPQADTPLPGRLGRTAAVPVFRELARLRGDEAAITVTVGELATRVGLSERTVQRATTALAEAGFIRVEERRGAASGYALRPLPLLTVE